MASRSSVIGVVQVRVGMVFGFAIRPSNAGSETTYFSVAQLPRSSSRQRSLQKGKSGFVSESVGLLADRAFQFHVQSHAESARCE